MTHRLPVAILILTIAASYGCRPRAAAPARDGTTITTAPATIEFAGAGVRFDYPAAWSPVPSDSFVLRLVPAGAIDPPAASAPSVSLDVPKLPPHIPGFIPIGLVVNGYVDDLKKQYPGVTVSQPVTTRVARANARRVRSTWDADGTSHAEDALLTVRGDRVYIFRASADAAAIEPARAALDAILASVQWE